MNFLRKPFKYTNGKATLWLIAANLLVFFYFNFFNIFNLNERAFALNVAGLVFSKMFWQPVTYMFMHSGWNHIFFNMLGLLFFGAMVERALGTKEFLLMYFSVGILSGLFSVLFYYLTGNYYVSLVGASGAIYGILFAYAVIFPKSVIFIWGIIPVPSPLLVVLYALIEFFSQFFSYSNVAHYTHLAGFGFAFLYFVVRMGINPFKVWKDAWNSRGR